MKRVLIIYYSGSGSTKTIAEILGEILSKRLDVTVEHIKKEYDYNKLLEYDLIVLGYPTYFFRPPIAIIEFVNNIPKTKERHLIFIFATCALTSGNSFKMIKTILEQKNYEVCGFIEIKGPASDLALTSLGFIKRFQRYESKIHNKLRNMEKAICLTLEGKKCEKLIQKRFSLVPLSLVPILSKMLIPLLSRRLYIDPNKCINCNKCVELCYHGCFQPNTPTPKLSTKDCELCLGCIHNCPTGAIKLSKRAKHKIRFDEKFYKKLKDEILAYFDF